MSPAEYPHADITAEVIGAFFDVYNELRSGLREGVYERAMVIALRERGMEVDQQVSLTAGFHDQPVGTFRADLVVAKKVLLELKALPNLEREHVAQTLNGLRASRLNVGLLLNFGPRAQIKRLILSRQKGSPGAS